MRCREDRVVEALQIHPNSEGRAVEGGAGQRYRNAEVRHCARSRFGSNPLTEPEDALRGLDDIQRDLGGPTRGLSHGVASPVARAPPSLQQSLERQGVIRA